ncbi:PTS transporter subunit EIIC [Actinomyces trachealis]|uniref:PTS transporter subunit EIIC n=1 Tax=Actinomyces trachealis TaxID=2763540 RepID=UPI0039A461BF
MSGNAALAGIVGYLVMVATIKGLIEVFYPGSEDMSIDTGVVGSLVVGGMAVWLHNRYHSIRLPQVLGFFGGSRFVPIVTSFAAILVGAVFFLVCLAHLPGLAHPGGQQHRLPGGGGHLPVWPGDAAVRGRGPVPHHLPDVLVHRTRRHRGSGR